MRQFEQKRKFKKLFFSRPVFVLFLGLLVLVGFSVFDMYKKSREAVLRNRIIESELEDVKQRRISLEAGIADLETDFGVEETLRSKFQVKKPGESYVVILDSRSSRAESENKNTGGFFKKLIEFFSIF
ncbi:MAG: hypothetical protein COT67_02605 [Candidatus Tagabacteria bacterium CG09_land_8_20_14_0_10_41_14]|uniref:Septum formation initiator n=2 Tax=Candidatus Tagaibacteriota TaxID=1817918 RepID=A0A2H0WMW8_9BACT|nr:MAG: hypothetical protein AUJ36_04095 [Parcubacteria group bacterium CG1_02_41_26]PIS13269.1 MAG: hypothetical protein COT67_02605 [Candidatus Tagabacteria bacterium CG09_land_8_20_14_0_10_41_14]PJE72986.1 MAG: hypothetical protein COV00_02210 [Candidatus Tagabacteria bacterium CG10_big_fil_rev_8_21_14_0_10_40_13]